MQVYNISTGLLIIASYGTFYKKLIICPELQVGDNKYKFYLWLQPK